MAGCLFTACRYSLPRVGDALLQILPGVLLEGLLLGCVYAMIALGYSMVYGVLGIINFAHSEVFMIGAVAGIEVFRYLGPFIPNPYLLLALALVAGGLVSGLVAVAMERLAYRPLRRHGSGNRLDIDRKPWLQQTFYSNSCNLCHSQIHGSNLIEGNGAPFSR